MHQSFLKSPLVFYVKSLVKFTFFTFETKVPYSLKQFNFLQEKFIAICSTI